MQRWLVTALLVWAFSPAFGAAQDAPFSIGLGPGVAHFAGDIYGTLATLGARAEWRFDGDFAAFGELRLARAGEYRPPDCVVRACDELVGGRHAVRAWHVGLETRLGYYPSGSRNRFTAFAGLGQEVYYRPERGGASQREADALVSLLVGVANRFAFRDRLGVRLAAGLSAWYQTGEDGGVPNVREVPMGSLMMTYELGKSR